MATEEQKQWQGIIRAKLNGPTAEQVWPLLEDFCNIYKTFPVDASFCVKGVPHHPGQIRYLAYKKPSRSAPNTTFVGWEKHKLLVIDQIKRYITYEMLDDNIGVRNYSATMTVFPENHGSQIEWLYKTDPIDGYTSEGLYALLAGVLRQAAKNIENLFRST